MTDSVLNVPLIAVPELPFRWLVQEDTINGQPVAHLLISQPNTTVRISLDKNMAHELADKLIAAVDGPRLDLPPSGLTVVERNGPAPNRAMRRHPANGGKRL